MKAEWKTFLVDNGAEFSPDNCFEVIHFGNPERELRVSQTGTVLCDLSHHGLIGIYGNDAASFLQNQTTNNIDEVSAENSQLSAVCNSKGRILSNFRTFRLDDTFYFSLPREMLQDTLDHLKKYVLMSKVSLEDANDALVRFGVCGPDAMAELLDTLGEAPENINDVCAVKGVCVIRVPGHNPRFEIYGELHAMQKLWEKLNVRSAPVGYGVWRLLDIQAGIPVITQPTKTGFIPQMINYEILQGVSFKKGCYPGQEVIARTQYLGKPKRRMFLLHFDIETPPAANTAIYSPAEESDQPVGRVISAANLPGGGIICLAVVVIQHIEDASPLHLEGDKTAVARVEKQPYET